MLDQASLSAPTTVCTSVIPSLMNPHTGLMTDQAKLMAAEIALQAMSNAARRISTPALMSIVSTVLMMSKMGLMIAQATLMAVEISVHAISNSVRTIVTAALISTMRTVFSTSKIGLMIAQAAST